MAWKSAPGLPAVLYITWSVTSCGSRSSRFLNSPKNFDANAYGTTGRRSTAPCLTSSSVGAMSWRFVAYEKFVLGSTLPAMSIGPCIENPPCVPTIVWPPISMVGAPRAPSRRPRFSMKNASLPRPTSPFVKYRPFSNTTALGSPSISTKKLRSGRSGRATKSVISSGGANLVSVSRGDSVYSNSPPSIRRARLSISVLIGPSSFRLPTRPPGRAALGIWKPIMWSCSPNRFSRGGRVWQTLHCRSYWRAKAGIAAVERGGRRLDGVTRPGVCDVLVRAFFSVMGLAFLVGRDRAGVRVEGQRTDVTEHHHHRECDQDPVRRPGESHALRV